MRHDADGRQPRRAVSALLFVVLEFDEDAAKKTGRDRGRVCSQWTWDAMQRGFAQNTRTRRATSSATVW
jgi:hypothetical protein